MRFAISYGSVHEFIIENDLTENDSILLHPDDFDTVAQEYIAENNIMIFRSMEILGVDILEDTAGEVKRNHAYVMPSVAS